MVPGIFFLIRRWKKMVFGIVVDHGFCKYEAAKSYPDAENETVKEILAAGE